ncbi:MAG: RagB/SusD family nutrient uptake outer membrane protein [Gemmatimonadota bacterium]
MRNIRCFCSAIFLAGAVACDTKVSNPGPVQDVFLNDRSAALAMVNGAGRALAQGINWVGYTGAAVAREIHPAGSTGSFGITTKWQYGDLTTDDQDVSTHWEQSQRARWLAEETLRRMEAAGAPPSTATAAERTNYANQLQVAYLYAGFANRLLGENMCDCVIDGSGILPNATYFTRAESLFTKALAVTGGTAAVNTTQSQAAYAGRAAARVYLNKWAEAVSDAGQVPITFTYNMPYFNIGDDAQRNRIAYAVLNTPYRAHTQWNTWHDAYRKATTDPRVPITTTTLQGDAAIDCCGRVPFWPQAKHSQSQSPVRLASGREMRLIEAEAKLRANDLAGGLASINQVRAAAPVAAVTAATITDAWTLLKRERGIELWLEGRRLGDLRRWRAANTPGALDPLESIGAAAHLTKQDLCFPIGRSERETNPNL